MAVLLLRRLLRTKKNKIVDHSVEDTNRHQTKSDSKKDSDSTNTNKVNNLNLIKVFENLQNFLTSVGHISV